MSTAQLWRDVQHLLGVAVDGKPGPQTAAAVLARLRAPDAPSARTFGDRLAEIALGEVGVREIPKNANTGPRVRGYQAATWLDGTGWPWCAAFVCWCVREARADDSWKWARPETAGAWDFEKWAKKESSHGVRLLPPSTPIRRGDILVYTFSHIGIAVADQTGKTVQVVEGNTDASGSREGGGVYRRTRDVSKVRSIIRI